MPLLHLQETLPFPALEFIVYLPFFGFCLALSAALGGGLTEGVVPLTLDSGVSSEGFMLAVPGRVPGTAEAEAAAVPVPGREDILEVLALLFLCSVAAIGVGC